MKVVATQEFLKIACPLHGEQEVTALAARTDLKCGCSIIARRDTTTTAVLYEFRQPERISAAELKKLRMLDEALEEKSEIHGVFCKGGVAITKRGPTIFHWRFRINDCSDYKDYESRTAAIDALANFEF